MVHFSFYGHMAPVFTPFKCDKTLNLGIIPEYASYLLENGIEGILINGTSGEGPSMNIAERKQVTEEWVKVCKENNQTLMVQIGGAPLPDVLELAKHAESIGVNSILCLPELYMKPKNTKELIKYLSTVSKAAPNTPLLYYHVPIFSNVKINMVKFLTEADKEIPTLVGIKYTSADLIEGVGCLNACNKKFTIFLGADQILAAAYSIGFDCAIATTFNIFPTYGNEILTQLKNCPVNIKLAQKAQTTLTNYINIITKHGDWVPTMKAAMNILTPIRVGPIREPMCDLTKEQMNEMNTLLSEIKQD